MLHHILHQFPERKVRMLLVEVENQFRNDFGVSFALETVTFLFQEEFHLLIVGNDTVVDHHETVALVRPEFLLNYRRVPPKLT